MKHRILFMLLLMCTLTFQVTAQEPIDDQVDTEQVNQDHLTHAVDGSFVNVQPVVTYGDEMERRPDDLGPLAFYQVPTDAGPNMPTMQPTDPGPVPDPEPDQNVFAKVWSWLMTNGMVLIVPLFALIEVIVRLTPTEKDNAWFRWVYNIIFGRIDNRKKEGGTFPS